MSVASLFEQLAKGKLEQSYAPSTPEHEIVQKSLTSSEALKKSTVEAYQTGAYTGTSAQKAKQIVESAYQLPTPTASHPYVVNGWAMTEEAYNSYLKSTEQEVGMADTLQNVLAGAQKLVGGVSGAISTAVGGTTTQVVGRGHGYMVLQSASGRRYVVKTQRRTHRYYRPRATSFEKQMQMMMMMSLMRNNGK